MLGGSAAKSSEIKQSKHCHGENVDVKLILALSAALITLAPAAFSQTSAATGSGFPGDLGRPGNGLPLVPGHRPWPSMPPAAGGIAMDLAIEAAQEAVAACHGFHVGVSIIDSAALPKLYYVADGTAGYHAYTAFRKAYTALIFGEPTSKVGPAAKTNPAVAAKIVADPNLMSFAGGIPIFAGKELIGAIGVSGAEPSAVDEKCAAAGLNKVITRVR